MKLRLSILAFVVLVVARARAEDAVQHCLLFKFKDGVSPRDVRDVLMGLDELPSKFPGIRGLQWGINNSPEKLNAGFTHGLIMTFESVKARDEYLPHPDHTAFATKLRDLLGDLFVFDFTVPRVPEPAEPGRVHHMVFFKFKEGTSKDEIDKVNAEFAGLEKRVSGLMSFQAGQEQLGRDLNKGFTNGYLLTFLNDRARNDYVIHPAHREFGGIVGPVLEKALVLDFTVVPSSRSLFVVDGLEPYAVYQRDANGTADLRFSGISRDEGAIEARLRSGRRTVPGFDWRRVGRAEGGAFRAVFEKVPAGGEYTVEVRRIDALGNIADHTEVANVLVGDLWILAGQSNMEGVGNLVGVEEPSPMVHCYTMAHRWELATEPLHWLIDSPDPVHSAGWLKDLTEDGRRELRARFRSERKKGAGLGLPFAKELVRRTGVPVGLIASAHGGTSMEQWNPEGRDQGGATLYGSMLKQVRNAGGKVRGVLWYQGESDANPQAAPLYMERMKGLVAAFRKDLDSPSLPFYYVQIGCFVRDGDGKDWNRIQELQRLAEGEIPGTAVVPVIDLPLDDLIHVGTSGLKRVGIRLAKVAERELFGAKALERGPRLAGIEVIGGGTTILVKYSGVNGRLLPAEKVTGFSLRKEDGSDIQLIFNASVDSGSADTVVLKLQAPAPDGALLAYGSGFNPICNLVDCEDMAAPVFGPLPLKR